MYKEFIVLVDIETSSNEGEASSSVPSYQDEAGPSTANQGTTRQRFTKEIVDKLIRAAEKRGVEHGKKRLRRKIQEHAECKICLKLAISGTQLQQCSNGHIICENCMGRCGNSCPTCRTPFQLGKIRALAIEQLVDAVDLKRECKHRLCNFSAPKKELTIHEKKCHLRLVPCPDNYCKNHDTDCKTYVPFADVTDHISRCHPDSDWFTDSIPHTKMLQFNDQALERGACWGLEVIEFKNKTFMSQCILKKKTIYAWMYILGDSEEAEKFNVVMSVGEGMTSVLAHYGKVFPIDTESEVILKEKVGILSFCYEGMGTTLFRHFPPNQHGNTKEGNIRFDVVTSKTPPALQGVNKLYKAPEERRNTNGE